MVENDRGLIAYCGLYCGDCHSYKGEIADLARDLRKSLRGAKFDRVSEGLSDHFKQFKEYDVCYEVLGAMVKLRCKKGCREGGGNPWCKVRGCCQRKNISGCWECEEFDDCQKLTFLETIHKDAHLKNLRKLKRVGQEEFVNGKRHW